MGSSIVWTSEADIGKRLRMMAKAAINTRFRVSGYYLLHAALGMCAVLLRPGGKPRAADEGSDLRRKRAEPHRDRQTADYKFQRSGPLWQPAAREWFSGDGQWRTTELRFSRNFCAVRNRRQNRASFCRTQLFL